MKIDPGSAISLRAVILRDLAALDELDQLFPAMDHPGTFAEIAATGYVLHNIYNALENSFEQISRTFENHVVDESRWHAELLGKMFLDMEGLRPRLFSEEVKPFLNDLRGFRHVFRHGYGVELHPTKLKHLVSAWEQNKAQLLASLRNFADQLVRAS